MSKSFDDILKKGKDAVNPTNDPKNEWTNTIAIIMQELHRLNGIYGDTKTHYVSVEQRKCITCGEATFIVVTKDFDNHKRTLKFHKSNWKSTETDKYQCDKCKKGKK